MTDPRTAEEVLAEALHDAMCPVSAHIGGYRCNGWPKYPQIAISAIQRFPEGWALTHKEAHVHAWQAGPVLGPDYNPTTIALVCACGVTTTRTVHHSDF